MYAVKLKNCNQFYGTKQVLHDISLNIPSATITGIIGKSGSGKSTLLMSLSSLSSFHNGEVSILGEGNKKGLSQSIGLVFQDYALWPHLTVIENIVLAPIKTHNMNKQAAYSKAHQWLEHFDIDSKMHAYPNNLSGGQKQKVAIIRCLMMNPKIILLDEPTAALDPVSIDGLIQIIAELKAKGITVVIASHDMSFIKHTCDSIAYIEDGSIKENGDINILHAPYTHELQQYIKSFK